MDYYKILEVPRDADEEQIKQAYRRKAKKYHPDLNPDDPEAEARFKDIVEAYEILGDAGKRKEYDLKQEKAAERNFGFSFTAGTAPQGQASAKSRQAAGGSKKNPLDVTEMFEAYMKLK